MKRENSIYQKLYREVKNRIYSEEYPIGSLLPTENEFVIEFGASRTTVRHALQMLEDEGFVHAIAGRGTEVIDFKTSQSLNRVSSITETLRNRGIDVYSRSIYIDIICADSKLANELGVEEKTLVFRIQRVQNANEVSIAIMKNYIPVEMVPKFDKVMTGDKSLYMCLEKEYGIVIEKARDKISARAATFMDAEILGVPVGEPLIAFARICYNSNKPVCVDHVSIVGKYYEFELSLTGREYN